MAVSANFDINIPALKDDYLAYLFRKRLGALAIITKDLHGEERELQKARETLAIYSKPIVPEYYYSNIPEEQKALRASIRVLRSTDLAIKSALVADLAKRARQLILIGLEMKKGT